MRLMRPVTVTCCSPACPLSYKSHTCAIVSVRRTRRLDRVGFRLTCGFRARVSRQAHFSWSLRLAELNIDESLLHCFRSLLVGCAMPGAHPGAGPIAKDDCSQTLLSYQAQSQTDFTARRFDNGALADAAAKQRLAIGLSLLMRPAEGSASGGRRWCTPLHRRNLPAHHVRRPRLTTSGAAESSEIPWRS